MKKKHSKAAALAAEINQALKLEDGQGVMVGSDEYFRIERIPTGSLVLDRITGGGFALGRHYELYGDENSAKSFILYCTIALAQERGKLCALVDPEHSYDLDWFEWVGGNTDDLLLHHPANAEEAVAVMMLLAKHAEEHEIQVIGIDSVASMVTRVEMETDPRQEDRIAEQARMMSRALRRITSVNRKTLFLWTNQERTNVGIKFGNPRTTSGGRALRFYATGRIEFRRGTKVLGKRHIARGGKLVESEIPVGRWIQCRVEKDKSTRPLREGSFVFDNEQRTIDPAIEIVQLGLEDGLIERQANGWYSYVDLENKEWRGTWNKFTGFLRDDMDLQQELVSAISDRTEGDGETDQTEM